ncbi:MAG: ATP-binding protein [Fimbriimonas sp.]|nr:ATP-binding protein [Fimbriimonas sp.]
MIRTRLTFWNAVVLTLVLTAFGSGLYGTERIIRYAAIDADLRARIDPMRQMWRDVSTHHLPQAPPKFQLPVDVTEDDKFAKHIAIERKISHPMLLSLSGKDLVDPSSHPWDLEGLQRAVKGRESLDTILIDGVRARVLSAPILHRLAIVAVAQVATPLDAVDEDLAFLGRGLLLMMPVAIVVTSFTGAWLTHRAMQPVRDIARAAEKIESTNLAGRLPIEGSDEFAELSRTFNGMLDRLDGSFRKLASAFEAQRRFTADASHELKTPLTVIKARVGVALHGDLTLEKAKSHFAAIDVASDRMTAIVRDLLLLARSDDGKLTLRLGRVSVVDCALAAIESVRETSERVIDIQIPSRLTIWGDEELLRRALVNLVGNACRHTAPDEKILVSGRKEGHQVLIRVQDFGEGIPPDHLPFVFDRLYRVDSSRNRDSGGSGLGLAIVKSIVEAHQGAVAIESQVDRYTAVTLTLPRVAADLGDSRKRSRTGDHVAESTNGFAGPR